MKINMYAWKLNSVTRNEEGRVKMFSSAPMHSSNVRKPIEANNEAELREQIAKFAEELKATGRPYVIGATKANERGNRAFRGFDTLDVQTFVNEDKATEMV